MTTSQDAWSDVADRIESLGLKLKMHAREELAGWKPPETETALHRLCLALDNLADAVGDAARDPAVRIDLRGLADALSDAATTTADDVRAAVQRARG